jgi:hypothetical protein
MLFASLREWLVQKSKTSRQRRSPGAARRRACLLLERLEDRLVPAAPAPVFFIDHGNLNIQGDAHDHHLVITPLPWQGAPTAGGSNQPGAYHIEDWQSNLSTDVFGVTGDLTIQLGGHSFVLLADIIVPGQLHVHGANLGIYGTTVAGSANLHANGLPDDYVEVYQSHFFQEVHLAAGAGQFSLDDSTFEGDVDVSTANRGPVSLNLTATNLHGDLKLETGNADPAVFNAGSYTLNMNQVIVEGTTEIHTGATDGSILFANHRPTFAPGMDLEHCFLHKLEVDVEAPIGAINLDDVHTLADIKVRSSYYVERFAVSNANFHNGINLQAEGNCYFQDVHLEHVRTTGAFLRTAVTDYHPPVLPTFDPPTFAEIQGLTSDPSIELIDLQVDGGLLMVYASGYAGLSDRSRHNGVHWNFEIQLDGVTAGDRTDLLLEDGNHMVRMGNCHFQGELHIHGNDNGTIGLLDLGSNTYGDGRNLENVERDADTTSVDRGLGAAANAPRPGPWVESCTPAPNTLRVVFDKPIDPATFATRQVVMTGDAGVPIQVTGIHLVPGSNFRSFDITFQPLPAGGYCAVIGPDIRDLYGNGMDQDHDGVNGQPSDTFQVGDLQGPRVLSSTPGLGHIRVAFSKSIDPTSFTVADVVLSDLQGRRLTLAGVAPVPWSDNTEFDLAVATFPRGGFRLTVGPHVRDCFFGNDMDQDQDPDGEPLANGLAALGNLGGPAMFHQGQANLRSLVNGKGQADDCYSVTYVDNTPPVFQGVSSARQGFGITVTFDKPIDPASFPAAAVTIFRVGRSQPEQVTGVQVVPSSDGRSFDIHFSAAPGNYLLALNSTITDLFGNHLAMAGRASFSVGPGGPPANPLPDSRLDRAASMLGGEWGIASVDSAAASAMALSLINAMRGSNGQSMSPEDYRRFVQVPQQDALMAAFASALGSRTFIAAHGRDWTGPSSSPVTAEANGMGTPWQQGPGGFEPVF